MKPIVRAVPVLVSVFAIALFVTPAMVQNETKPPVTYPELPSDIPAKFKPVTGSFDYTRRRVMIPMRDGVKLHTVILIPKVALGLIARSANDHTSVHVRPLRRSMARESRMGIAPGFGRWPITVP